MILLVGADIHFVCFFFSLILFFSHPAIAMSHATRMILSLGARFGIQKEGPGGRLKGFIIYPPSVIATGKSVHFKSVNFGFL